MLFVSKIQFTSKKKIIIIIMVPHTSVASLMAQRIKNPPTMWETRVRSLSWEDPLEKGMATHSSILVWRIPWTEEPGGLVHGMAKSQTRLSD